MEDFRLIPVHPENLEIALKDVNSYIVRGLPYIDGKFFYEDIVKFLSEEELVLWVIYNDKENQACGCLITEVLDYPQIRALSIFLLSADDFSQAVQCLEQLKDYAKRVQCKSIEFMGREGWEKKLEPHNFKKIHTIMRLKL